MTVGVGIIRIMPKQVDLKKICSNEIELQREVLPAARIDFTFSRLASAICDPARVRQVDANLIANAASYDDGRTPFQLVLNGDGSDITLSVVDSIPTSVAVPLAGLFEPLQGHHCPTQTAATWVSVVDRARDSACTRRQRVRSLRQRRVRRCRDLAQRRNRYTKREALIGAGSPADPSFKLLRPPLGPPSLRHA